MIHPRSLEEVKEVSGQVPLGKELKESLQRGKGVSLLRDGL